MSLNVSEARTVFQNELDKQMMEELTSSFMDDNAGEVIYEGGSDIKIPSIEMDGLKEYSRKDGYPEGGVSLSYETMKMTMDRGASFQLDAMDVAESNFLAAAGTVMGEFQRLKVAPEVDAYRYSSIYKRMSEDKASNVVTKALTASSVYGSLIEDMELVRDECGQSTPLVILMSGPTRTLLYKSSEFNKNVTQAEFKAGNITTRVKSIDECPIILVPSARMYTKYTFHKGNELEGEKSGFEKGEDAKLMNYIVMPRRAVTGVCKQDKPKIITPEINQKADAWLVAYRKFHDAWIKKSMLDAIRVSVGTA